MTSNFRNESVSLDELADVQLGLFIYSQSVHLAALARDRRLAPSEEASQAVDEALDEFAALVDERSERERKSTVVARDNTGGAQSQGVYEMSTAPNDPAIGAHPARDLTDAQIAREILEIQERLADLVAERRVRAERDEEIDEALQARGI